MRVRARAASPRSPRRAGRTAEAPLAATAALARVLGDSHFLGRWLLREPDWADDLAREPAPAPAPRARERRLARAAPREVPRPAADRRARSRAAVRRRAAPSSPSSPTASCAARSRSRRASREPPALFALGKLGGRELNFSSDVDLLFVCDAPPDDRGHAARESAAAVVRELKRRLDEPTDEGFAYRVDLDLRPEGPAGALVRGVEGTLGYYELRGAEWERQMLLRLRHLAGAPQAARAFERGIEPFVYRRAIDPGVIDAVRAMKARIETERREHGRDIDENLKEGPGGIRDVEFTVQALQLFYAGRRAELRTGNVLAAIEGLARAELLPASSAAVLADGYRWLRRAEHALQLAEEQQTAQLPRDAGRAHRARAADGLCGRRGRRRDAPLRGGSRAHAVAGARAVRGARAREPRAVSALAARFDEVLAGTPLDARRSPASARFAERRGGDAAAGRLLRARAARPRAARGDAARDRELPRQPARHGSSRWRRSRRARSRSAARGSPRTARSSPRLDLESALDFLRLRRREETALAACAHLGGLAPFEAVSEYLSLVAEITTRDALELARRHVRGAAEAADAFAVIGMGKIAGREFTYHSDLDLIFLYGGDAGIDRASRLGQRLIAYLTTMTGAGVAYEVDTRLRPSGQQGMLVASFEGYERYQTRDAATWEHLAMLRARPIAGAVEQAAERLRAVRARVLPHPKPPWRELADLRQRVIDERARGDDGVAAFKTGAGGLMDVDFVAGGGILERGARPYPDPPSVAAMLAATGGAESGAALLADYHWLRRVEACARWVAGRSVERLPSELAAVAELVEPGLGPEALREQVAAARARIRAAYDRVIAQESIAALDA